MKVHCYLVYMEEFGHHIHIIFNHPSSNLNNVFLSTTFGVFFGINLHKRNILNEIYKVFFFLQLDLILSHYNNILSKYKLVFMIGKEI